MLINLAFIKGSSIAMNLLLSRGKSTDYLMSDIETGLNPKECLVMF
jgi:hypothetical protein